MPRTTVIGAFDHGIYGALERVSDHLPQPAPGKPRQILWRIYAKRACSARAPPNAPSRSRTTTAPASCWPAALRSYANRWAAVPGQGRGGLHQQRRWPPHRHRPARQGRQGRGRHRQPQIGCARGSTDYEVFAGAQVIGTAGRLGLSSITVRLAGRRDAEHRLRRAWRVGRLEPECPSDLPPARPTRLERGARRLRPGRRAAARHERRGCRERAMSRPPARLHSGADRRGRGRSPISGIKAKRRRPCPRPRMRRSRITPLWHVAGQGPRLARPAERRDRQGREAGASGGLPLGRASQALHHARHGDRSGQDRQCRRAGDHGGADGQVHPRDRHHDLPPALYAGADRGACRPIARARTSARPA